MFGMTRFPRFIERLRLGDILSTDQLIELDYQPLMHHFYQNFSDLPGFVLLESSEHKRGRYDIVSAYPFDRVVINDTTSDKEAVLKLLKKRLSILPSRNDLPFQGGAIGYISYDFGAQLHGIQSSPQFTLRGMPLLDLGFYDWAFIVDHYLKKSFLYAANRHPSTKPMLNELLGLWKETGTRDKKFAVKHDFQPLISKADYEHSFNQIYQDLIHGRSYQVNLTQPFHAEFEGDTWAMYKNISSKNHVPFAAFLRTKEAEILSFSPERFLRHDNGTLLTSPIKGTIHRSEIASDDELLKQSLISSIKNRSENVMIVDLLRNDLGKIAKSGSVKVLSLCELQSFKSVHHLVSDIEAECFMGTHPLDNFISCFPGGSITGAPKLEAMRIINEQEPFGRGVYCGSIAYFSQHGRFDSSIAIRTITAKEGFLHLAAGGAVVIDSRFEDEYRECYTKITAIINGLK